MTNKEAYERDLRESIEAIRTILAAVPQAKTKKQEAQRKEIEFTASQAIANLECMSNDYIVKEVEELQIVDKLTVQIIGAAGRVNDYAKQGDINRNHTNYGDVSGVASALRLLGHDIDYSNWEDNGYLKIGYLKIDDKKITF